MPDSLRSKTGAYMHACPAAEYDDICEAAEGAKKITQPMAWRALFKKEYRPSLVLAVMIPTFQQWTGINAM